MSELRQDPLTHRWVIVGSERGGRPNEFVDESVRMSAGACPFCAGNEGETPPALANYPAANGIDWQVRVVPNKFPALAHDTANGSTQSGVHPAAKNGKAKNGAAAKSPLVKLPGRGQHEVVIESPRHVVSLTDLTVSETACVFRAYRDRLQALRRLGGIRYVQIFKNVGPAAGASMQHAHSQIIALDRVPESIELELGVFREAHEQGQPPLLEAIVAHEVKARERLIAATANYVAFCPWASRFAYEVCITPRRQQASFEAVQDEQLSELARLTRDMIGRIERALGLPAYNLFLRTQPFDSPGCDHYHWHIAIFPRVTKTAGFEWSTGCFINPVPPEAAAETLRTTAWGTEKPDFVPVRKTS